MVKEFIEYYKNNEANLLHSILLSVKDSKLQNKESMGCRSSVTLINELGWIDITFIDKKLYTLHINFDVCDLVAYFNIENIKINDEIRATAKEIYNEYFGGAK